MAGKTKQLGLSYKALDLHVHTPGSKDFRDQEATPSEIIEAAEKAGLAGICVTDHNTAEWVDKISAAAKGKQLVIFPGIEVSVTAGKEGLVHIIAIFEPGKTSEDLNDFLSNIGLTREKRGRTDEIATGAPNDIINGIVDHGGIPVLAHADSSHGVLHDMKGTPRTKIIQNPNLFAAEVTSARTQKFLDGNDPTYKRFLPTYEASDAHSIQDIGSKKTFFRLENVNFEGLKQCFFDPEVRICTSELFQQLHHKTFPNLLRISVKGGFFDNETIEFHPCQNAIIGGQGVGKSLIVELIRFVLDQPSKIQEIIKDTQGKLQDQLGLGGSVTAEIQLTNGTRYQITKEYQAKKGQFIVNNLTTGEEYKGKIPSLFPIIAYSQTEAVHISRNPQAQLELIDRFIATDELERRRSEIIQKLRKNDHDLAEVVDAAEQLGQAKKDLHTIQEEISNIEKSLKSPILKAMKEAENKKAAFDKELDYHDELIEKIKGLKQEIDTDNKPIKVIKKLDAEKKLVAANDISKLSYRLIGEELQTLVKKLEQNKQQVNQEFKGWMPSYNEVKVKYDEFFDQAGGSQKSFETRRKGLQSEEAGLEEKIHSFEQDVKRYEDLMQKRNAWLDVLDDIVSQEYDARKEKYNELTQLSEGKLMLEIKLGENRESFSDALQTLSTGTRIRKADINQIADSISPREFVELVINQDAERLAEKTRLETKVIQKLVTWLSAMEAQEQVLSLQYQQIPEDVPSIQFQKDDGKYYEISGISVGQKCTALLIIALTAGEYPIIIDQPEESIDIASVFSDVVLKLRRGKDNRQFILTTHNPNVAVTADADLIQVLKSSATQGNIVNKGVIEDADIRHEVIQHLEGGEEPYRLRGKKYGLLD